jgi:dephospho-CoA kinase
MRVNSGKLVIGLVGGIGSGKSLVARQLAALGCGVIDSDQLARQALEQPMVRDQLVGWWGPKVLGPDGRVDRRAVGDIVFKQPAERQRLEALVHPQVHQARAALRHQFELDPRIRALVEDMPLLMEKGFDRSCDVVVFISASREVRLRRVQASRGWGSAELDRREKAQMPLDSKAARADYIVENNGDEVQCHAAVNRVLSRILQSTAGAAGNPPTN